MNEGNSGTAQQFEEWRREFEATCHRWKKERGIELSHGPGHAVPGNA